MKVTIPKKPSGRGSIYDLESQLYDNEITFVNGTQFAIVYPAYYNANVELFKKESRVIRRLEEIRKEGYEGVRVIDRGGNVLEVYKDILVKDPSGKSYNVEK